ncbi:uncharacterized protein [Anolis sagrei]|uniref:uncharacterized protein isoform X2 n=1 Tax=Anolis sagrei TaxID=38937 RepID=UPI003521DCF7
MYLEGASPLWKKRSQSRLCGQVTNTQRKRKAILGGRGEGYYFLTQMATKPLQLELTLRHRRAEDQCGGIWQRFSTWGSRPQRGRRAMSIGPAPSTRLRSAASLAWPSIAGIPSPGLRCLSLSSCCSCCPQMGNQQQLTKPNGRREPGAGLPGRPGHAVLLSSPGFCRLLDPTGSLLSCASHVSLSWTWTFPGVSKTQSRLNTRIWCSASMKHPGSVVVEFDAIFLAMAPGLWVALDRSALSERLPPGLWVGNASLLRRRTQERHLDPCATLFSCRESYECVATTEGALASATCVSACHRDYCKNQGICTHAANQTPVCHYRRFCRLDDVSAHYWSKPWLASASSLDNLAFSNSEELLHLQILDTGCYGTQEEPLASGGYGNPIHSNLHLGSVGQPSSALHWEESSLGANDPMIDSGKASEVSICSWPLEPIQWSPFHGLKQGSNREPAPKSPRPLSCCEEMELVSLERSWTA